MLEHQEIPNRKGKKMPKIEAHTRAQIIKFLPIAIRRALSSYRNFTGKQPTHDPKDFKDRHGASKVAVAHIQLLIKLAEWADLPEGLGKEAASGISQEDLGAMIQSASAEIKDHLKH